MCPRTRSRIMSIPTGIIQINCCWSVCKEIDVSSRQAFVSFFVFRSHCKHSHNLVEAFLWRCRPRGLTACGSKVFVVRWSAQQTIGSRSASLVKWFGCWILCIAAIAQFFDEYKFAFPVYASSIGHGHPEDSGHGQKVVPKPEILKIERKSAKGADVLLVSSDSAEDVHPHQQSGPKTSDVHSPQCIGKAKPFDLESDDYISGEEPQFSDLQHMEVDRELFQQHVQDVLDCFLRGGDCVALLCSLPSFASSIALLSDEVELRLMENALATLRGQTVNGNAATEVSIPTWLCHPWPLCVLAEARAQCTSVPGVFYLDCMLSSFNALLHRDVTLDACGFKIRPRCWWRPLVTQNHALCSQLCTIHLVCEFSTTSCLAHQVRSVKNTPPRNKQVSCPRPIEIGLGKRSQNERLRARTC